MTLMSCSSAPQAPAISAAEPQHPFGEPREGDGDQNFLYHVVTWVSISIYFN